MDGDCIPVLAFFFKHKREEKESRSDRFSVRQKNAEAAWAVFRCRNRVLLQRSTDMRRYNRPEPIGQAGSLDLYMYAGGCPVMRIDPTGLDPEDADMMTMAVGYEKYKHIQCDYDTLQCSGLIEDQKTGESRVESFRHPKGVRQDLIVETFGNAPEGSAKHTVGAVLYMANELTAERPEEGLTFGGGIKAKGAKKGREIFERFMSKTEADATQKANGLVPKFKPHQNNPKWIGDKGVVSGKSLGKTKQYTHKATIKAKPGTREWLKQYEIKPSNEPGRYAIPSEKLDEFNSMIDELQIGPKK